MDGDLVSETKEFERELAMHTAPAMLGIKPANLLTVEGSSGFISGNMARFNSIAAEKGLHIKELRRIGRRSLMLLYNEKLLADRLEEKEVRKMFRNCGYGDCKNCRQYLEKLMDRMADNEDFPHEIGLFLGYPVDDVRGFIDNKGRNCLFSGYWKVYTDEENARRTFNRYNNCRKYMIGCLDRGEDIYKAMRIRSKA